MQTRRDRTPGSMHSTRVPGRLRSRSAPHAAAGERMFCERLEARELLSDVYFLNSGPAEVLPETYVRIAGKADFGLGSIQVYFSQDKVIDPQDVLVHSGNINAPRDSFYGFSFKLDDRVLPGDYYLVARTIDHRFPGVVSVAASDHTTRVYWSFGSVGAGQDVQLTLHDGDSTVTFTRTGPGTGNVSKNPDGTFDISMEGSTTATGVRIFVDGGDQLTGIRNFTTDGALGLLYAPTTSIRGSVNIAGSLGRLEARDLIGVPGVGARISITGSGDETFFKFRHVANASISSVNGIAELTLASKWSDTDTVPDLISATYLTSLTVNGNFAAGLRLSASRAPDLKPTLGAATIAGQAGTNAWWVNGGAGEIGIGSTSVSFSASFFGSINALRITLNNFRGVIAADNFRFISIARTVDTGKFLAGADLGRDGRLGGSGQDADLFSNGVIGRIDVGYKVLRGLFAAGLKPGDGIIDNGNDSFSLNPISMTSIGSITIGDTASADSRFLARQFNGPITINGASVIPQNDRRFALREFIAPTTLFVGGDLLHGLAFYFVDNLMIDVSTIDNTTFTISGPNGYAETLQLYWRRPLVNARTLHLVFKAPPPGGSWDSSDNGRYTISVRSGGFTDLNGNGVAAATVRNFDLVL